MANLNGFNAAQVEPSQELEALPAGKYVGMVTKSEMKPTKNGAGQYLELTFQILEGPHKNRLVWARLNLQNTNATTVQIARQELSALCRAVGVLTPRDSTELHNIPVLLTLKLKRREDTGDLVNEVRGYAKREAAPATASAAPAAPQTAPWRR